MHINGRIAADVLAQNVLSARMRKDWTQNDVALQLKSKGIAPNFLSRLEMGHIKFRDAPTLEKVKAVCSLLKVDIPYETEADRVPPSQQPQQNVVQLHQVPQEQQTAVQEPKKTADLEIAALANAAHALSKIDDAAARRRILGYLMERFAQ